MVEHAQSARYGQIDQDFVRSLYDVSAADDAPFASSVSVAPLLNTLPSVLARHGA